MAIEKIRGCGYRKVGGMYLVGTGIAVPCDMLPLEVTPCHACGYEIPFSRTFMWINKKYIERKAEQHHIIRVEAEGNGMRYTCKCSQTCPLCFPTTSNNLKKYGWMWVHSRQYSPESFIKEAKEVGVSKRIAKIPKGLVLGETWVLLAHRKIPFSQEFNPEGLRTKEPEYKPAIFYAFRPTRIEKLVWKSKATNRTLKKLEKQGITPIIIPDGDKDHAPKK